MDVENKDLYVEAALEEFRDIITKRKGGGLDSITRDQKGESFVLHVLSKKEEMLPSELSLALGSSAARISAVLGALEKKGLVTRKIDSLNRRNILVSITEDGRMRVQEETLKWRKILETVFLKMGEQDTFEYLRLMNKFHDVLHEQLHETDKK